MVPGMALHQTGFARSLDQVDLAEDASIVPGVIGQAVPGFCPGRNRPDQIESTSFSLAADPPSTIACVPEEIRDPNRLVTTLEPAELARIEEEVQEIRGLRSRMGLGWPQPAGANRPDRPRDLQPPGARGQ